MSYDYRGKNYSHPQITIKNQQQDWRKTFELFKNRQKPISYSPLSNNLTTTNSKQPLCHLQIFKNRFTKGRQKQEKSPESSGKELSRDLKKIGITSPLGEGHLKACQPLRQTGIMSRQKGKEKESKTVYNFFFSGKKGNINSDKPFSNIEEGNEFEDKQFRKSKSIIIIRRLAKKKEKLAQQQSEHNSCEFLRKRELPIHNTQYRFSFQNKTEGNSSPYLKKHLKRTNKAIQDILRLQEVLREEQNLVKQQQEEPLCTKYISYDEKPRILTQPALIHRKVFERKKKKVNEHKKEDEHDLGPWKRSPTNDFQAF